MVCEVKKCCECLDLKCGCFTIGYLRLIANLVLPVVIIVLAHGRSESKDAQLELESVNIYVILADCILNTVLNIVLIVGLHKNYRGCLLAYIIYSGFSIAFRCVVFIMSLDKQTRPRQNVHFLMSLVWSFYFLAIIISYYIKMNEPEMGPAVIYKRDSVEA